MSDESSDARGEHERGGGVRRNNEDALLSTTANHEGAQKWQRLERGGSDKNS